MLKKIKIFTMGFILIVCVTTPVKAENVWVSILQNVYSYFWDVPNFDDFEHWKIYIQDPGNSDIYDYSNSVYIDHDAFTETGVYEYEPTIDDYASGIYGTTWSDAHEQACGDSPAYRKMSIRGTPDSYLDFMTYSGEIKSMKSFTVNQGVPFDFSAHRHGWLTRQLRDTFYFWTFGDGIRRFNKKKQDNKVDHVWKKLGNYTLSSIVYSEDYVITIGFEAGTTENGDFGYDNTSWNFSAKTGSLYLEGCDVANIEVVPNNAPVAKAFEGTTTYNGTDFQKVQFSAKQSYDPDGNPLTYTWRYNGSVAQGKVVEFHVSSWSRNVQTVSLTVSDGGLSDTTTLSFTPKRCDFNCPIMK